MAASESTGAVAGVKRPLDSDSGKVTALSKDEESSSDDDLGPALPSSAPQKKKRRLAYERTYISALPQGQQYSKSLMHKEQITSITITPFTDFVITSSLDGVVKFWKKAWGDVEFVKEFKAHDGTIRSVSVSADGRSFATAGADSTIKIFDVITFDLLSMVQLPKAAVSICYIHKIGASMPLLAVAQEESSVIEIYDCRSENNELRESIKSLHRAPVTLITYNSRYDCVISCDNGGMLEYWSPEGTHEKPESVFKLKSATNLFEFKKAKSVPSSITVSPSGKYFATFSFPDRRVRIFDFTTGKLYRTYDESTSTLLEMQQTGTALKKFEEVEFGRRIGVERETEGELSKTQINVIFDESSNFIIYGSLQGLKVVNILTNQVVKVYGANEPLRALNLAIYQGAPLKKGVVTAQMAASSNPLLDEAAQRDPVLICTALGRPRFYMFTNEIEISKSTRDVQNEKPRIINGKQEEKKKGLTGTSAIMHTNKGDIHLRLFPDMAPKTVENFVTLSKRGFYNNTIFHRVVAKFMIQGGDPRGDGTGGESIWGGEFEDEITSLKHDQPYTLSMANAGKNTNLSQFFITTVKTPHLDGIHTVFGRAVKGHDVIHKIEHVKTNPSHRPIDEEIKIINIEIH